MPSASLTWHIKQRDDVRVLIDEMSGDDPLVRLVIDIQCDVEPWDQIHMTFVGKPEAMDKLADALRSALERKEET